MNLCLMIGRLTKDVDLKYIPSTGKAVANFSIAVDRPFSKEKQADFFNVQVWGKIAENCANYLTKGSKVAIKGTVQNRSYEHNGEKKYITEIIADTVEFLDSKKDAEFTPKMIADEEYLELKDSEIPF